MQSFLRIGPEEVCAAEWDAVLSGSKGRMSMSSDQSGELKESAQEENPLDFFGFSERPLDLRDFTSGQLDLFSKVERALTSMEEDLLDKNDAERELLSTIMKIHAWRNLRECIGASLQNFDNPVELEKYILECATLFYKELDHPYWSTTQFQYLLHLNPARPNYWAGYGLCLMQLQDRGAIEEFRLEEKAAIAFIRAARLCLAHLLMKTDLFSSHPDRHLIELARRYYGNAGELVESNTAAVGGHLCTTLEEHPELQDHESIKKKVHDASMESIREEIVQILSLSMERNSFQ